MKVCYLDLSPQIHEDYSLRPKRYGGGRIFAAILKEFDWFHIYAKEECFNNLTPEENKKNCHVLKNNEVEFIKNGGVLDNMPIRFSDYDLIIVPHVDIFPNLDGLKAKSLVWALGYGETIHKSYDDILLYNFYQGSIFPNPDIKKHFFTLGIELPPYPKEYEKKDYVFQCSRHDPGFGSIEAAQFCLRNNIQGYFAGPIVNNYPLLNFIDNKTTHYLGQISQEEKLKLTREAGLYTFLHSWETPMNLSALESISLGTPICAPTIGFWPSLIIPNINGFFVHNEKQLLEAWCNRKIEQRKCYETISHLNSFAMIESLKKCFKEIIEK